MAFAEIYVDPAIAADSGTGTIGDPFGDLQFALDNTTQGAAGDRFNIKAGTDEVLSSALSLVTYGTPSGAQPLIFEGYTSAAGDGGIGGISGGGSVAVYSAAGSYITFRNLNLHNCGAATVVTVGPFTAVVECEINNTTGSGVEINTGSVIGCHFHDIGTYGIYKSSTSNAVFIQANFFQNGTKDFTDAIRSSRYSYISHNVISVDGSSNGINCTSYGNKIENNSILSSSGTGKGVICVSAGIIGVVVSNLVEGFSGAGGVGIEATGANDLTEYGNNGVFDCTTEYDVTGDTRVLFDANETLSVSPFAKSGADTFANRAVYFAPVATGSVRSGAFPTSYRYDKGAIQHADVGLILRRNRRTM